MHFSRYLQCLVLGLMSSPAHAIQVTAPVNGPQVQNAAYVPIFMTSLTVRDDLLSMFPSATPYTANFTAPGGNLLQPPSSIVTDIITAVPPTVLALLMIPARRSSISSEIQAGNTPGWYESLPAEVKSYVSAMKEQVSRGDVDLNATRTPPPTTTASEIEEESDDEDSPATEASTGLGSRTTGEMATLAGALGVLGLATAL